MQYTYGSQKWMNYDSLKTMRERRENFQRFWKYFHDIQKTDVQYICFSLKEQTHKLYIPSSSFREGRKKGFNSRNLRSSSIRSFAISCFCYQRLRRVNFWFSIIPMFFIIFLQLLFEENKFKIPSLSYKYVDKNFKGRSSI